MKNYNTHVVRVSLLFHKRRELDEPQFVRGDGSALPGWRRLRLYHLAARHGRRRLARVRRLGERLDILGRARLQTRLPELLMEKKERNKIL